MVNMNRKQKILKKRRLKNILKNDYCKLNINDIYMIATCDYDEQQLEGKISELEKPPLWDWFTLVNKKKNKIWYVDFSCPYIYDDFFDLSKKEQIENISRYWAIDDTPFKIKYKSLKGGFSQIQDEDPNYDLKLDELQKKYIIENDWDRTIQDFKEKNEFNKNWDDGLQLNLNYDKDGFGIIVPFSYKDKTFLEIFTEAVNKFNQSKFSDKYLHLINEINYIKHFK